MGNKCCVYSASNSRRSSASSTHTEKVGKHHFNVIRSIGQGYSGDIFLVEKVGGKSKYAMKVLKKRTVREEHINVLTERQILSSMKSPFIVKLHYSFQSSSLLYFVIRCKHKTGDDF